MKYQQILYEVQDAIATITMNRPDKMNAMTLIMAGEIKHAMESASKDKTVRVIILTGHGKAFCAGADVSLIGKGDQNTSPMSSTGMIPNGLELTEGYNTKYAFISSVPKPVIAAINGVAVGAGLLIALHCDMRFAVKDAKLSTIFAKRGLVIEYAMPWLLTRIVGPSKALDLSMSARIVLAEEALKIGLVDRITDRDNLIPTCLDYAYDLAKNVSPRSIKIIKQMIYRSLEQTLCESTAETQLHMDNARNSNDYKEGIQAWKENRPPEFTGS